MLAAITRYYGAYYDIIENGQCTSRIAKMHKTYGELTRFTVSILMLNEAAML